MATQERFAVKGHITIPICSDISESEFVSHGWMKTGAQSYRHHCGARLVRRRQLWTAISIDGTVFPGHSTALHGMSYLKEHDSSFWTYGCFASGGGTHSFGSTTGYLDADHRGRGESAFICHVGNAKEIPTFLGPVFKRYLFGRTHCNRCLNPMTTLATRVLREFHEYGFDEHLYIVCGCGYPVWSVNGGTFATFTRATGPAETKWRRKERLRVAGGRHRPGEIRELLALQENRCIYCNAQFTNEAPPTKDHVLAVADGGTDFALNIVMACWRCNCRRSDIPFRTYCRLLSWKQNQRILTYIAKRLASPNFSCLPCEAISCFDKGLAQHNAKHPRFLNMKSRSIRAGRNAVRNELLPRTRSLLLKKYPTAPGQ